MPMIIGLRDETKNISKLNTISYQAVYGPCYRVYFVDLDGENLILHCGGVKGSQKRDIQRAKEYWQELRTRTYE